MSTVDPPPAEDSPAAAHKFVTLQWVVAAIAFGLLAVLCSQHSHSGMKGTPVPLLTVVQSIIASAIVAALIGLRFHSLAARIACPFAAGIAGAFATADNRYGPYGAILGLLVGTIMAVIPLLDAAGTGSRVSVRRTPQQNRP